MAVFFKDRLLEPGRWVYYKISKFKKIGKIVSVEPNLEGTPSTYNIYDPSNFTTLKVEEDRVEIFNWKENNFYRTSNDKIYALITSVLPDKYAVKLVSENDEGIYWYFRRTGKCLYSSNQPDLLPYMYTGCEKKIIKDDFSLDTVSEQTDVFSIQIQIRNLDLKKWNPIALRIPKSDEQWMDASGQVQVGGSSVERLIIKPRWIWPYFLQARYYFEDSKGHQWVSEKIPTPGYSSWQTTLIDAVCIEGKFDIPKLGGKWVNSLRENPKYSLKKESD